MKFESAALLAYCMACAMQLAVSQFAWTCDKPGRFDCLPDQTKSEVACFSKPFCKWCERNDGPPGVVIPIRLRCQTDDRSCITPDTEAILVTTSAACEAAGGVYCEGDQSTRCVYPEPARSICLKKNPGPLCSTTGASASEFACHQAGCVWCSEDIFPTANRQKCFARPAKANCGNGATCCRELVCLGGPNPDQTECEAKGCHICTDNNGNTLCNFGPGPTTTTPTTTTPTTTTPTTTTPTTTTPTTTTPTTTTPTTTTPTTTTPTTTTPTTTTPTTTTPTTTTPTTTTPTTTTPTTTTPTTTTPTTTTPTTTTPTTTTPTTTTPTTTTPTTTTPTTTTPTTTTPTTTTPTTTTPTTTTPTTTTPTTTTPTTTTPTTPAPPACPTDNVEDCVSTPVLTEQECDDLDCEWCTMTTLGTSMVTCKRNKYADTCDDSPLLVCSAPLHLSADIPDDCPTCKAHGCEWCGDNSRNVECHASTGCGTCACHDPKPCTASTVEACSRRGCLWCVNGTSVGNCINVNAEGLLPGNANEWTPCSRTCGGGTRSRYSNCSVFATNPYACPKEFETCNSAECALPSGICEEGVGPRYMNGKKICCMSQTRMCGINTENILPRIDYPAGRRRRSLEEDESDESLSRVKRVIGGIPGFNSERWPWLVAVYNLNPTANTTCAGVIVHNKLVLTHVNCVGAVADMAVHADTYNRNQSPGMELFVSAIHPSPDGMIVALELNESLVFDKPCIHPVCLPSGENLIQDSHCVIAGWGLTDKNNDSSCSLTVQETTVRAMPWVLCEQAWGTEVPGLEPPKHFCAGIPEGGKDYCYKDTGAPLVCQRCDNCGWYVAGIATNITSCGEPQKPSVYANVSSIEDWVTGLSGITNLDPKSDYSSCPI